MGLYAFDYQVFGISIDNICSLLFRHLCATVWGRTVIFGYPLVTSQNLEYLCIPAGVNRESSLCNFTCMLMCTYECRIWLHKHTIKLVDSQCQWYVGYNTSLVIRDPRSSSERNSKSGDELAAAYYEFADMSTISTHPES